MYMKGLRILEDEFSGVDVDRRLGDLVDGIIRDLVDAKVSEGMLAEGG
jgi:hypothetical protein